MPPINNNQELISLMTFILDLFCFFIVKREMKERVKYENKKEFSGGTTLSAEVRGYEFEP